MCYIKCVSARWGLLSVLRRDSSYHRTALHPVINPRVSSQRTDYVYGGTEGESLVLQRSRRGRYSVREREAIHQLREEY
jgi:hypothetical protein